MILIISFLDNEHVRRVTQHLSRPYTIVDNGWFPSKLGLRMGADADNMRLGFRLPDGSDLDLMEVGAVWHRRIKPITLDPALTDEVARLFAWSESTEALMGTWYSIDCFWMNPPMADEVAQRKIRQLQLARQVGLSIPETLITNIPEEARAFIGTHGPGEVIRKAFRNIAEAPRETARVEAADLGRIDSVRFAPVIFQKFVAADLDLRTTAIDGEMFTASFRSDAEHQVDYRSGIGTAEVARYRLPDDVADKLQALMDLLGLKYGAVDFRVTPEGEHVFLEVNPGGEYLFVADRTEQPIAAAIAACLERHDREFVGTAGGRAASA